MNRFRPLSGSPLPQGGFSLIEVLISMMVLGGLATSVFYFISTQNGMGRRSNDLVKSLNLGKLTMDSLKVTDYAALEGGSDTVANRFIRSWRISKVTDEMDKSMDRKKIELTVYWPLTAERHLAFASIMSDSRFKEAR